jgi:hypothetical protein
MPTDAMDYLHSLLTLTIVGIILTSSFAIYVNSLVQGSEVNHLKEVLNQVAAEAMGALVVLTEDNATVSAVFSLPLKIGNQDYWIRLGNDSSASWVEGAFGSVSTSREQECRVYLPKKVYASGTFEGGYQLAQLVCVMNGSTPQITLSRRT